MNDNAIFDMNCIREGNFEGEGIERGVVCFIFQSNHFYNAALSYHAQVPFFPLS